MLQASQKHNKNQRRIGYFSLTLDLCSSHKWCTRSYLKYLYTPCFSNWKSFYWFKVCNSFQPFHLSLVRSFCFLFLTLLSIPSYIPTQYCQNLYSTELLPLLTEEQSHDCIAATQILTLPHPGLVEILLIAPYFIDSSYLCMSEDGFCVEFTTTDFKNPVECESLPNAKLTQVTKFLSLAKVCTLATDKRANVYLNSRYLTVVHNFDRLWRAKGFMPAALTPIKNKK